LPGLRDVNKLSRLQPRGVPRFYLAFHLPYYVLESSESAPPNGQVKDEQSILRKAIDISFLKGYDPKSAGVPLNQQVSKYLRQVQVSCTVVGSDNWNWTAYLFLDTFINSNGERESVECYQDDDEGDGEAKRVYTNPLTAGELLNHPLSDPREHFLRMLHIRVAQCLRESNNVVDELNTSIPQYVRFLPLFAIAGPLGTGLVDLGSSTVSDQTVGRWSC
jgi:hypothetical protein